MSFTIWVGTPVLRVLMTAAWRANARSCQSSVKQSAYCRYRYRPSRPRLHKVIDGAEIKSKADLSGPHTVHCLGSEIIISFLGNAKGEAPGGYLHLNKDFEIVGRWENTMGDIKFGYDFWYQPAIM